MYRRSDLLPLPDRDEDFLLPFLLFLCKHLGCRDGGLVGSDETGASEGSCCGEIVGGWGMVTISEGVSVAGEREGCRVTLFKVGWCVTGNMEGDCGASEGACVTGVADCSMSTVGMNVGLAALVGIFVGASVETIG